MTQMELRAAHGEVIVHADLAALAAQIARHHERARAAAADAVTHAIAAGGALLAAKAQIGHGGWLAWLDANFDWSERTAQLYMHLARHREEAQRIAGLGIAGAARALSSGGQEQPVRATRRPPAIKRADDLADLMVALDRDAEREEGRLLEVVEAFVRRARTEDLERARLLSRLLLLIAIRVAEREDPRPPILCPTCGAVPPGIRTAAECSLTSWRSASPRDWFPLPRREPQA